MERFDIETYDFINDEEFQAFFKEKLGGRIYPKAQYMRKLESTKKAWIRQKKQCEPIEEETRLIQFEGYKDT